MDNTETKNINLEPLHIFFNKNIPPVELAQILDDFLFHYIQLLALALKKDNKAVHENTTEFVFYIKSFRDTLLDCEWRRTAK